MLERERSKGPAVQKTAAHPGPSPDSGRVMRRHTAISLSHPWAARGGLGQTGTPLTAPALQLSPATGSRADASGSADVQARAARGVAGAGGPLPHLDRIQASFGGHDVSTVQAHSDAQARQARLEIGAQAYAMGEHVALEADTDLHTTAHEAAHVIQQRNGVSIPGGVGQSGDAYERHADAVADQVVRGESAETLLAQTPGSGSGRGVQRIKLDQLPPWLLPILQRGTDEAGRPALLEAIDVGRDTQVLEALSAPIDDGPPELSRAQQRRMDARDRAGGPDWGQAPPDSRRSLSPGQAPGSTHTEGETLSDTFQANQAARLRETFGSDATVERVQRAIRVAEVIGAAQVAQRLRAQLFQVNQYGVIDSLNPEGSAAYQRHPQSGQTYCTYYSADVVTALGGNLPRGLTANRLNDWLNEQGARNGWERIGGEDPNAMAQAAQAAADNGDIVVCSAAHRSHVPDSDVRAPAGHVAVIVAQRGGAMAPGQSVRSTRGDAPAGGPSPSGADVHNDFRAHTEAVESSRNPGQTNEYYNPLETNAGGTNFNYGARRSGGTPGDERTTDARQWWRNGTHTRGGFWRYTGPRRSPIQAQGLHEQ